MATIPFLPGGARRRREPLTGARLIIVGSTLAFALFLLWAMLAQVDEVTSGQGKVIPTSKAQLIQAAEPATIREFLVRSGQRVKRGQLLARLDDTQSASELGQIQAETQSLAARSARLRAEGLGGSAECESGDCEGEAALQQMRQSALRSKVAALNASADQRRREVGEAQATISSLRGSLSLAQRNVDMLEPLAAKNIVPQTELLNARREVVDLTGRIAAAQEQSGRAQAAIREAQAQASEAGFAFRQDALNERSQINAKIAVNEQSLLGARGRLNRNELRSPVDGVVSNVQVTTVGGFVQAGQAIMEVVPVGE